MKIGRETTELWLMNTKFGIQKQQKIFDLRGTKYCIYYYIIIQVSITQVERIHAMMKFDN